DAGVAMDGAPSWKDSDRERFGAETYKETHRRYGYEGQDAEHKAILGQPVSGRVSEPTSAAPGAASPADRQVIRKANIELKTRDVRASLPKATMLPGEAGGEFGETPALAGPDNTLQATLTPRVGVARLSTVLGRLRELGEVVAESAGGEDVTDQ